MGLTDQVNFGSEAIQYPVSTVHCVHRYFGNSLISFLMCSLFLRYNFRKMGNYCLPDRVIKVLFPSS